jgi:hypothetical protein
MPSIAPKFNQRKSASAASRSTAIRALNESLHRRHIQAIAVGEVTKPTSPRAIKLPVNSPGNPSSSQTTPNLSIYLGSPYQAGIYHRRASRRHCWRSPRSPWSSRGGSLCPMDHLRPVNQARRHSVAGNRPFPSQQIVRVRAKFVHLWSTSASLSTSSSSRWECAPPKLFLASCRRS